jgi:outer membrane protein OmpA-like peptidoglycan-associated protein
MRAEGRILIGLAMIGAGGAGLLAMNLWTLPPMLEAARAQQRPCPSVAASWVASPAPTPEVSAIVAASASVGPTASAAANLDADAGEADAGATARATDGTTFPPIRFEERSRAPSRDLMTAVQPLAAYLRGHFDMKVVLIGHGDAGMSAAEYVQTGRVRAGVVLRMLVDYGVSASRITVQEPTVDGDRVVTRGVAPGTVEASVEPRFETRKGGADVP